MKFIQIIIFAFLISVSIPMAFAEGGGGVDCPQSSGNYTYVPGSANYKESSFEGGEIGVLKCEFETESESMEFDPFGEITAIFHLSGELSQDLIDEYGCGAILGEQYSPTYVSSETHFASVAFSMVPLAQGAGFVMEQIEEQNLASTCILEEDHKTTVDIVKEAIEEHEEIEDVSVEVKKEEIKDIEKLIPSKSGIVLPEWIKNNAAWWAGDLITDSDFAKGLEYMIQNKYIIIPFTESSSESDGKIPDWVKNNADWWSQDLISDVEFVNGLQFLISNGIIQVS